MQRRFHDVLLSIVILGVGGCFDGSASNSKPKTDASAGQPSRPLPPPPPPPSASPTEPSGNASPEQPAKTVQPPAQQAASSPPSPPPAAAVQLPVQLATGVALAQTGPEGTMMMFSVDYEVTQGEPNSAGYLWVIDRAHGNPGKVPVKLTAKGALTAAMVVQWKPEDGPFHSHLEDRKGNRVSESIEMR